jgi:preprotein translocase subunit SecB
LLSGTALETDDLETLLFILFTVCVRLLFPDVRAGIETKIHLLSCPNSGITQ